MTDPSACSGQVIHFGSALYPPEDRFRMIDRDTVAAVRGKLGNL